MNLGKQSVVLSALLVLTGCMTMFRAQQTQRELVGKGEGAACASAKVDLSDYSLRELVAFAMTNRPSMAAAALAVADARLALREIAADAPLVSGSPWNSPRLSVSGGYSAASASDSRLRWRTDGNASAGLSLDILLYDFGRNNARANQQVENVIASEYDLIREGYAVFEDVSLAYFNLMEKDALLAVALTNETENAIHLQQAEYRLSAGEAQKLDVTRAKLELSQARENTIVASNEMVIAGAELMKALGLDAAKGGRDAVYPSNGRALAEALRGFADTGYGLQEAYDLARTNSPAMAIARARLRAASHAVDYAVADLMPSVSASVGISWADPLWAWHWGVSAAQSIFQGFRKVTAVDRAVVAMHEAAVAVDEAEQKLSLDLEAAIATRDNAVKKRDTARASVLNAREDLAMVKAQYLEGEASRVDFTVSVSSYATALGSRVKAFYAGQRAEAVLFGLLGRVPEYREETVKEN